MDAPLPLPEPVARAWTAGMEVDAALLEHLVALGVAPDPLDAVTPGGGLSVAQHLAHLVNGDQYWAWRMEPARIEQLPTLYGPGGDVSVVERNLVRVREVLLLTRERVLDVALVRPEGDPSSPHADASGMLLHLLVHHAHHRGQILLALKAAGHPLPDEERLWGPWRPDPVAEGEA